MSAQVLCFNNSFSSKNIEDYLLVQVSFQKKADERFCLSPDIMHWRDDLWLIDMRKSKRYWLAQALGENTSIESILLKILKNHNLELKKWIQAKHPWQALFIFDYLKPTEKLYHYESLLCQNILKKITWRNWLKECKSLLPLLEKNIKSSKTQKFRSKQAQLLRAMKRLGIEYVYDITEADSSSMQKRFGYWIGKLWEWTFPQKSTDLPLFQQLSSLNEFIWVAEKTFSPAYQERHLDYSVEQWDHLEAFLVEDFELLCNKHFQQKKLSICEMLWTLQLYSGKSITLKVSFRNPYPIFDEAPEFTSALNQFRYQFDSWQENLQEEKNYHDYNEAFKIVSWNIQVTKSIFCANSDLSFSAFGNQNDYLKILSLENKLPKAIKQYQQEESFLLYQQEQSKKQEANISSKQDLWKNAGLHRPLFCYRDTKKIKRLPTKSYFLERNSTDWWKQENTKNYNQDFFKAYTDRQYLWISKNSEGEIQVAGQFD